MPEPRERPILFSGPMVRAILAGAKTQTRRVVKLPVGPDHLGAWESSVVGGPGTRYTDGSPAPERPVIWHTRTGRCIGAPLGVGDRAWCREAWAYYGGDERLYLQEPQCVAYRATWDSDPRREVWQTDPPGGRWRPSIHMPRWASRILLEVVEVRVQRLQEISEEDARAEGMQHHDGLGIGHSGRRHDLNHGSVAATAYDAYAVVWDLINGKRAPWASNPWVWAYTFRALKGGG